VKANKFALSSLDNHWTKGFSDVYQSRCCDYLQALLCNYFDSSGSRAKIVVPKPLDLQQLLCQGPAMPLLSRLEDDDEFGDFDDE
jgi:hypothetical protein